MYCYVTNPTFQPHNISSLPPFLPSSLSSSLPPSISVPPAHLITTVTLLATTVASKFTVSQGKEQIIQLFSVLYVIFVARTLVEAHFAYGGLLTELGPGPDAVVIFNQIAQLGNGLVLPVVQLLTSMLLVKQHDSAALTLYTSTSPAASMKSAMKMPPPPSRFLASIDEEDEECDGGGGKDKCAKRDKLKLPPLSQRDRRKRASNSSLFASSCDNSDNNDNDNDNDIDIDIDIDCFDGNHYNGMAEGNHNMPPPSELCRVWSTTSTDELKMTADSCNSPLNKKQKKSKNSKKNKQS